MYEKRYFETIAEYRLLAKHEVGQNFLVDSSAAKRIVDALEVEGTDSVLEIGSGAGSLSYFLAESGADVDLIDIDEALVTKLEQDFQSNDNVHPLMSNALKHDCAKYGKIIGNLPYYITSGILEHVFLTAKNCRKAVFMIQKEALSRLLAQVGSEDYGPLNILMEFRSKPKRLFTVPRTSFSPAPHIDSAVFVCDFRNDDLETASELYRLTSAMFLHRRKTILNNLSMALKDPEKAKKVLAAAKIDERKRPQNLTLQDYLTLLEHCNRQTNE